MSKRKNRLRGATSTASESTGVSQPGRDRLPTKFIVTSMAATLNLTAAMLGVGFPEAFPALAAMPVMLALFAVGLGLEVWAVRQLLAARRMQAGQRR